jgi:hypothetical protein
LRSLSPSLSAEWLSIVFIQRIFHFWVCPLGWSLQTKLRGRVIVLTV